MISVNKSLSARRAWIEITALLKSVKSMVSLSARRAWIEIHVLPMIVTSRPVALRKESVDRNPIDVLAVSALPGRSPQGERG